MLCRIIFTHTLFIFADIGHVERKILDNIWFLYSSFPQNDECDNEIDENHELCKNLLNSAQSSMRLASENWNNLLVKMSRECRTSILIKDVEQNWGNDVKMTKNLSLKKQFSENFPHRKRRVAFLFGILGVLVATSIFSAISYAIAKAVVESEIVDVDSSFEKENDIIIEEQNKTEVYLKQLSFEVYNIDVRVSYIERYVQLHNYGIQSSQKADSLAEFMVSKIYPQEAHYPLLDREFQSVFQDEISGQSGLDLEARNQQIFELKQKATYVSWIIHAENSKCSNTSVSTVMVLPVMEKDTFKYKPLNNSDGFISDAFDSKITYQNRYGLKIIEEGLNIANLDPKKTLLANRRFTTIEDTRIVFSEPRNQLSDRFSVFFLRNYV